MIELRPVLGADAESLFPLIYQTPVLDTLVWDGPASFEEFHQSLVEREIQTIQGERHNFTIIDQATEKPIGMISIRPDMQLFRGEIGLWLGEPYHSIGYGTQAVQKMVKYGFEHLRLEKIEALVFVDNWASRRIFEKNGFLLEGTIRCALRKRGQLVDDWLFGLTRTEYKAWREVILHLCSLPVWQAAQKEGAYRPASLITEGFVHCSRPEQILDVANRFYFGVRDLCLLWIEMERLQSEVLWEPVEGDVFPHIYGLINLDAVSAVTTFMPDGDGHFRQFPRR